LIEVEDVGRALIQDELFGPVMVLERFADEAHAIERANATRYGLAASVWTSDAAKARWVAIAVVRAARSVALVDSRARS
jgi:acyl-CoA reductase-like NAD-dependent aldehyde dehydrogenase